VFLAGIPGDLLLFVPWQCTSHCHFFYHTVPVSFFSKILFCFTVTSAILVFFQEEYSNLLKMHSLGFLDGADAEKVDLSCSCGCAMALALLPCFDFNKRKGVHQM
jgi:hypothetical protein